MSKIEDHSFFAVIARKTLFCLLYPKLGCVRKCADDAKVVSENSENSLEGINCYLGHP